MRRGWAAERLPASGGLGLDRCRLLRWRRSLDRGIGQLLHRRDIRALWLLARRDRDRRTRNQHRQKRDTATSSYKTPRVRHAQG
jgi:hypothetical protein